MELKKLRNYKLSQVMTLTQLAILTQTSSVNVNTKYKPWLTVIEPFPADHNRPTGKQVEFILCDRRLKRLLRNLSKNGKASKSGVDVLAIAEENYDFI